NCATTPFARTARIAPVGAPLKNSFGVDSAASDSCASTVEGTLPAAADCLTCRPGRVSQPARASEASWSSELTALERNEPRQLAAPPGKPSAKSQPVDASPPPASTCPCTTPSIQPGQTKVAKVPSTKDLPPFQSHAAWAAD